MTVDHIVESMNEAGPEIPYEIKGDLVMQGERAVFYIGTRTLRDVDSGEELVLHEGRRIG